MKETNGKYVVFVLIAIVLIVSAFSVLVKKKMKERYPADDSVTTAPAEPATAPQTP